MAKQNTVFQDACKKFHINHNLVMLKLTLFVMYGGKYLTCILCNSHGLALIFSNCYSATSSLVPFLTVHMQSVGLTVEEIAIIYLALPLTTFLAPPVTGKLILSHWPWNDASAWCALIVWTIFVGFLVDKFGHYKPVLFISLALNAVFHHSLMLIPQMETPAKIPPAYVMRHPHNGKVEVCIVSA